MLPAIAMLQKRPPTEADCSTQRLDPGGLRVGPDSASLSGNMTFSKGLYHMAATWMRGEQVTGQPAQISAQPRLFPFCSHRLRL